MCFLETLKFVKKKCVNFIIKKLQRVVKEKETHRNEHRWREESERASFKKEEKKVLKKGESTRMLNI